MDFAKELERKLTGEEYNPIRYYIEKATDYYKAEKYSDAKESLLDAIAICKQNGELNAAGKVQYYLRFC